MKSHGKVSGFQGLVSTGLGFPSIVYYFLFRFHLAKGRTSLHHLLICRAVKVPAWLLFRVSSIAWLDGERREGGKGGRRKTQLLGDQSEYWISFILPDWAIIATP